MRCIFGCALICAIAVGSSANAGNTRRPVIQEIDLAMESFVQSRDIAGAVTLVAHRGKVVHYSAVGVADIDRRRPMKETSLFSIASMTKPIVATGVMILQDEGKLSVDDKVSKFIPEFANVRLANGAKPAREITIRECLSHTSGLQGEQKFRGSLEEAVDALATKPLAFQPRRHWKYSPGMNVAGRIIEIVSGRTLDQFLQEKIFGPLEMNDTTFFPTVRQIDRMATLYRPAHSGLKIVLVPEYSFLGKLSEIEAPNPSGGLISHTRDMFRFYQMILNRGVFRKKRIVSAAAIKQMLKPQPGTEEAGFTPGNNWGLGWCLVSEPQGVTGMLSKGSFGHGGAYGTQVWIDPTSETLYLLMIQRSKLKNSDDSPMRLRFQTAASQYLSVERTARSQ